MLPQKFEANITPAAPTPGQAAGVFVDSIFRTVKNGVASVKTGIERNAIEKRLFKMITNGEMPALPDEFSGLSKEEQNDVLRNVTFGVGNALSKAVRDQAREIEALKAENLVIKNAVNELIEEMGKLTIVG